MRTRTLTTGLAVLGLLAAPTVYAATANADPDGDNIVITEVVTRFPNVSNNDANAVELHTQPPTQSTSATGRSSSTTAPTTPPPRSPFLPTEFSIRASR